MHRQPCHMLLGRSVMRTEMHGSFTEHRGSRLAVGQTGLGQYGNEKMAILLDFSSLVLNLLSPFLSEFFGYLTLSFFPMSLNRILNQIESELAAVGSRRMLFPNCVMPGSEEMATSRAPPGVTDLGLGLQSLRLSGWDRPWSSQDTDTNPSQVQTSSPSSKYQLFFLMTIKVPFGTFKTCYSGVC